MALKKESYRMLRRREKNKIYFVHPYNKNFIVNLTKIQFGYSCSLYNLTILFIV